MLQIALHDDIGNIQMCDMNKFLVVPSEFYLCLLAGRLAV